MAKKTEKKKTAGRAAKKGAKGPAKRSAKPPPVAAELRSLPLAHITADPDLQPREGGSPEAAVEEYAEAITAGAEFPPLVVYEDRSGPEVVWWLSEGFTRYAAYGQAGKIKAPCEVRTGTRADALVNSCGSNAAHGLRRTSADKRRAVAMLHAAFPRWSDRKIADAAGVYHQLVADVRRGGKVDDSSTPKVAQDQPAEEELASSPPVEEAFASSPPLEEAPAPVQPPPEPPRPAALAEPARAPHREPAPKPSSPASTPPAAPEPADPERDQLGRPLVGPLAALVPVFESREAVRLANQTAGELIDELKTLDADFPVGGFLKRRPRFVYDAERIAEFLRLRVAPYCACPVCDFEDPKCPTCGGKGWLARAGYEQLHPTAAEKARQLGTGAAPDDTVADRAEWTSAEWAASGRDSVGNTIPPRLRDDFACDDLLEDVRDLKRIAFQLSEGKGALPWLKPEAHEVLAQALRFVSDAVPYAVCVGCSGRGCAKCLMSGYHPRWSHESGANTTSRKKPGGE